MSLTEEEKQVITDSFTKIAPIADQVAEVFYKRLFEVAEDTKPLFESIDIQEQGRKLMQTIATAVGALYSPEIFDETFEALGKRHVAYGVSAEQYEAVGSALIWALGQCLGDDFNDEVEAAWRKVYGLMSDSAKRAYTGGEDE